MLAYMNKKRAVSFLVLMISILLSSAAEAKHDKRCRKKEAFVTLPARTFGNEIVPEAQIFYRQEGNCCDDRPTIVFVHGLGATANNWLCQQKELCDCYCTIAYDQRGFGRSSKSNIVYFYEIWAQDLHAIIQELGIKNPIIVASSFGGTVAISYVTSFPGEASKLVLADSFAVAVSNSTCPPPAFDVATLNDFILPLITSDYDAFKTLFTNLIYNEACQNELTNAKAAAFQNGFPPQNIMLNFPFLEDLSSLVPSINLPTLVTYGGIDAVVPIANSHVLRQQIPGSFLVEFFDKGHFAYVTDYKRFTCTLRKFINNEFPIDCQVCPLVKPF